MSDEEYKIYLKGFMDGVNDTSERFKSSAFRAKHDTELLDELLDKVAERINSLHYDTCDAVTRRIEHRLKAEVFKVITELKAEVNE